MLLPCTISKVSEPSYQISGAASSGSLSKTQVFSALKTVIQTFK